LAVKQIKEGVESILKEDMSKCKINLPKHFKVELSYTNHWRAYKASFYPKMKQLSSTNVAFESDDYFEILRMLLFVV
jgi:D-amino peptidase